MLFISWFKIVLIILFKEKDKIIKHLSGEIQILQQHRNNLRGKKTTFEFRSVRPHLVEAGTTFLQQHVRICVLSHIEEPPTQLTSSAKNKQQKKKPQ